MDTQISSMEVLIESDWNLKMACWLWWMMLRFSINRIRLEFKVKDVTLWLRHSWCINRIRLEFKDNIKQEIDSLDVGINRIRLEFKVGWYARGYDWRQVLIESDWNLKEAITASGSGTGVGVLIESDWNLKINQSQILMHRRRVLIESDWNLKKTGWIKIWKESFAVLIESDWNLKGNHLCIGGYLPAWY